MEPAVQGEGGLPGASVEQAAGPRRKPAEGASAGSCPSLSVLPATSKLKVQILLYLSPVQPLIPDHLCFTPPFSLYSRCLLASTFSPPSYPACAADDGLDALREEVAGSAPAATQEQKLAAALADLVEREKSALRRYKEARDKGKEGPRLVRGW